MKSGWVGCITQNSDETIQLGKGFADFIQQGDVYAFVGELASGKTTFIKGLLKGMGFREMVNSPTFTLINEYHADKKIIHIDFYRENKTERWKLIGLDDYLVSNENITIIEWGNLHSQLLPKNAITINFEHIDEQKRKIILD